MWKPPHAGNVNFIVGVCETILGSVLMYESLSRPFMLFSVFVPPSLYVHPFLVLALVGRSSLDWQPMMYCKPFRAACLSLDVGCVCLCVRALGADTAAAWQQPVLLPPLREHSWHDAARAGAQRQGPTRQVRILHLQSRQMFL